MVSYVILSLHQYTNFRRILNFDESCSVTLFTSFLSLRHSLLMSPANVSTRMRFLTNNIIHLSHVTKSHDHVTIFKPSRLQRLIWYCNCRSFWPQRAYICHWHILKTRVSRAHIPPPRPLMSQTISTIKQTPRNKIAPIRSMAEPQPNHKPNCNLTWSGLPTPSNGFCLEPPNFAKISWVVFEQSC